MCIRDSVYAELQPVKNLKIKSVFGVVYGSSEYRSFKPLYKFSQYIYNDCLLYTSVVGGVRKHSVQAEALFGHVRCV